MASLISILQVGIINQFQMVGYGRILEIIMVPVPRILNWRENQFDIVLKSGKKIGDPFLLLKLVHSFILCNVVSNGNFC